MRIAGTLEAAAEPNAGSDASEWRSALILGLLLLVLTGVAILSLTIGAVRIAPGRIVEILWARGADPGDAAYGRDAAIVFGIRLPRTLLGIAVGAGLAYSGAVLQGLFRNPLADPALIGVSPGSTLAAATVIVFGHRFVYGPAGLPFQLLPAAAFCGALAATLVLYAVATRRGRTSVATMLLAGIALSALASAGTGFLSFLSDDRQLRDLSFWILGSVGGATWGKIAVIGPMIAGVLLTGPLLARPLNALVLGEAEAFHLGFSVQRLKTVATLAVATAVGGSVAAAGLVGFVGLVVPHVIRITAGADHRLLLPASAILGATLLVLADVAARIAVAPAELPIGIVTAFMGAPYFLWLLLRRQSVLET